MEQQGIYNAAVYCRLSRDDDQQGDSTSIQTQKMILESYCLEHNYIIRDYYVDDGYSGTTFNRPGFQRMLGDVEDGKINLVITKDLSRLGRDYIMTGYYTEIFFCEKKVRYIAVNDNVDTLKADNDIAPFKNILNDMYAKDISRKVKSAKRQRALQGMFISGQPPYGYKRHPENINKLIIDEEPAEAIREIFRLALEGKGCMQIAKALTAKRFLIPSVYKRRKGDTRFERYYAGKPDDYDYRWTFNTILNMMKDRVYVGDMVNHKCEIASYKTKKHVLIPQDKHIIVENTHEPIVSREDFERVRELVKARHTPNGNTNFDGIFRGIVFCAECGRRLTLGTRKVAGKMKPFYRCHTHHAYPQECKRGTSIYYEDLYGQVKEKLKAVFGLLSDDETLERLKNKAAGKGGQEKAVAEKTKIEKRLSVLSKLVKRLYEDYAAEALDGSNYLAMLGDYQREQQELNGKLVRIIKELEKVGGKEKDYDRLKTVIDEFKSCKELTAEMLNKLIDRIEIGYPERTDGIVRQEINIIYRFISMSI
jgi:DNA invertase Pin-like site-specific DNA recombinase